MAKVRKREGKNGVSWQIDYLDGLLKRVRLEKQLRCERVFTNRRDGRLLSIKNGFKSACRRAGVEDFRFHDLRLTFASHFIMRGESLKELQEILSQKDVKMTMRDAHLSQAHKKRAVNLLNGLTSKSVKSVTNLK